MAEGSGLSGLEEQTSMKVARREVKQAGCYGHEVNGMDDSKLWQAQSPFLKVAGPKFRTRSRSCR